MATAIKTTPPPPPPPKEAVVLTLSLYEAEALRAAIAAWSGPDGVPYYVAENPVISSIRDALTDAGIDFPNHRCQGPQSGPRYVLPTFTGEAP